MPNLTPDQTLRRLTDALDELPPTDQARTLYDLAKLKPNAPHVFGLACLRAGFDADEADELVRLFASVPKPPLAEVLELRAEDVCDTFELCRTCLGNGCHECQTDSDREEVWTDLKMRFERMAA